MAISDAGIFGQYRGKLGKLVYYQLHGKTVVRTIGENTAPPSLAQLACRQEMKVTGKLLKPALTFINAGFRQMALGTDKSPYNFAVKYNKENALQGVYPDIKVDYAKVLMAQGTLLPAQNAFVEAVPLGLRFSWEANPDMLYPRVSDQTLLLAYFPETDAIVFKVYGAFRGDGEEVLQLPLLKQGLYMETYISFVSEDRKETADSVYTGSINP